MRGYRDTHTTGTLRQAEQLGHMAIAHQQISQLQQGVDELLDSFVTTPAGGTQLVETIAHVVRSNQAVLAEAEASRKQLADLLDRVQLGQALPIPNPEQQAARREARHVACFSRRVHAAFDAMLQEYLTEGNSQRGSAAVPSSDRATIGHGKEGGGNDKQDAAAALAAIVARVRHTSGLEVALADARSGGRPSEAGETTEVVLSCADAWHARVALSPPGTPSPVRVMMHGVDEPSGASPAAGEGMAWKQSQHVVFRKVSALATRALGYFLERAMLLDGGVSPSPTAASLEDLLLWLSAYQDLFTRKCSVSGTLLAADPASLNLLPPLFRPYKLTRPQLIAAAAPDAAERQVYHLQAVPAAML